MEEKELRIGNLIDHNIFGNCEITALDYECICIQRTDKDIKMWFDADEFIKIELTEEWLLKFGAKKAGKNDAFGGFIIYYPNGNGMRVKNNEWSSQHITVKLDYVHQLQNLYFALTGEELILKEEITKL